MNTQTFPQKFIFDDHEVDFEIQGDKVMVNATQMAKIFNAQVNEFTSNAKTKEFISECLKNGNSRFLGMTKSENSHFLAVEKEEDLIISVQKSGTWMHRVVALKFAAWLNPAFELWVYSVIDELLFGHYKELEATLRRSAENRNRIDALREQLREDPIFAELETLELLEKQNVRLRQRKTTDQLLLFRQLNGHE